MDSGFHTRVAGHVFITPDTGVTALENLSLKYQVFDKLAEVFRGFEIFGQAVSQSL